MERFRLNSLDFNLAMGCRLRCRFCPQDLLMESYWRENKDAEKMLSYANFKTILSKVEPKSVIAFCGASEPLSNPDCIPMVQHAYQMGHHICLLTTLTGVSIKELASLKDIPFAHLVIHIPDNEGHSKFIVNEQYIKNLRYVIDNFSITNFSCHGSVHTDIYDLVSDYEDSIFTLNKMHDRAGNLKDDLCMPAVRSGQITCVRDNSSLDKMSGWNPMVMPDGRVVLCCMDYGMEHVLGNLLFQTWDEITSGKEFHRVLDGINGAGNVLCNTCALAVPVYDLPAYRLKRAIEGKESQIEKKDYKRIIEKFRAASAVAVVGLGSLFQKHYFTFFWDKAFDANFFADSNKNLHGMCVANKIPVINPAMLKDIDGLLAVVFAQNAKPITAMLDTMGVEYIKIADIYDLLR